MDRLHRATWWKEEKCSFNDGDRTSMNTQCIARGTESMSSSYDLHKSISSDVLV